MAAGLFGGRTESWLMWMTDITMSIPVILLAMLINTALKYRATDYFDAMYTRTKNPFFLNTWWLDFLLVFVAIALISWPGYARLIRGQVKTTGKSLYVEAARSTGASDRRIMTHHLAPNSLGPVIVAVTQGMGGAFLIIAGLNFLGIGIQPPAPDWATMIAENRSYITLQPWTVIAPTACIALFAISVNIVGEAVARRRSRGRA